MRRCAGVARRLATSASSRLRVVALNASRIDFDGRVNYDKLAAMGKSGGVELNLTRYDSCDPDALEEIAERVDGHEVVINKEMPMSRALIAQFPSSVRLICEAGTGFNNIDLAAAKERGITVCNIPTYSTEAMAHMAITFVMAQACSLVPQMRALATGDRAHFDRCHLGSWDHFELNGRTIGLIGGLGTIGQRVATIAQALGMHVIATSRRHQPGLFFGVEVAPMSELLRRSDFVSIHCPLNADTRGLIDAEALKLMKPTAYIVNTARGAIIDEAALIDALKEKRIAGAALDVMGEGAAPPPPHPPDHPLFALDNVILTPHIGWQRLESRQRVVEQVTNNIVRFAQGRPINQV